MPGALSTRGAILARHAPVRRRRPFRLCWSLLGPTLALAAPPPQGRMRRRSHRPRCDRTQTTAAGDTGKSLPIVPMCQTLYFPIGHARFGFPPVSQGGLSVLPPLLALLPTAPRDLALDLAGVTKRALPEPRLFFRSHMAVAASPLVRVLACLD